MAKIYKFFKPLDNRERELLSDAIRKLLGNKQFQLFVRDMFHKAPPLQPDFLSREQYNSTAAAVRSGEKNVSRALLKMIMDAEAEYAGDDISNDQQANIQKLYNGQDPDFSQL